MDIGEMSLGTIGGPETFAGQSSGMLRSLHPELPEPIYFESAPALFAALRNREVDAVVGAGATVGGGYTVMARMIAEVGSDLNVLIEEPLPFNCALLGRHGSTLATIRCVYGGLGSLAQARAFVTRELPHASTAIYEAPGATARTIAHGDGSLAMLGTRAFAQKWALVVLADDVDGGAVNGIWWVVSRHRRFDTNPKVLFVTGRFGDDGQLGRLASEVTMAGYSLCGATAYPSDALLEFDYLLRFRGTGRIDQIEQSLAGFPAVRLAGAISPRIP